MRALGCSGIFLVLSLLTPPVSACFNPCMEPVISQAIPLMVAFGVSALLAIGGNAIRRALKHELKSAAGRPPGKNGHQAAPRPVQLEDGMALVPQPPPESLGIFASPECVPVVPAGSPGAFDVPRPQQHSLDQVCQRVVWK
eukprot:gene471-738_t